MQLEELSSWTSSQPKYKVAIKLAQDMPIIDGWLEDRDNNNNFSIRIATTEHNLSETKFWPPNQGKNSFIIDEVSRHQIISMTWFNKQIASPETVEIGDIVRLNSLEKYVRVIEIAPDLRFNYAVISLSCDGKAEV